MKFPLRKWKIKNAILLLYLLCVLCPAQILIFFTARVKGQQSIIVTIESPREDATYNVEQIIPIRITVKSVNGSAIENATVIVTTKWDNQFVHVPFRDIILENGFEVAVYAPDPNYTIPQGSISEDKLIELNNNGFLRLPVSEGEWWLTFLVKPPSPDYLPYTEDVAVRVLSPGFPLILCALGVGWALVIIIAVTLVKKAKKRS